MVKQVSTLELSQRILDMAESGVYRELILEALQPLATQKQIRAAIAQARHYGLYSVPQLRDQDLGTFYLRDPDEYHAWQKALASRVPLETLPLPEQLRQVTLVLRQILWITGGGALVLGGAGVSCLFWHQTPVGWGLVLGGVSLAGIWGIQRKVARHLI